jgi:RNA polymerase sigma factor (sigma-70 family)
MCGDRHLAEDLVQTALYRLARHWSRAREAQSIEAYARRTLMRCYFDHLHKYRFVVTEAEVPDRPVAPHPSEVQLVLRQALATLSPGARAVVVLRFFVDLSVEQTAAVLGVRPGTVKSQTHKALARLRVVLGDLGGDLLGDAEPAHARAVAGGG